MVKHGGHAPAKNYSGDFANPSLNARPCQNPPTVSPASRAGLGILATRQFRKREYISDVPRPPHPIYTRKPIAWRRAARATCSGGSTRAGPSTAPGAGTLARYVNHKCRPNAEAVERRGPIIVYVARRKIKPGEEITVDYGQRIIFPPSSAGAAASASRKCPQHRAERQVKYRAKLRRAHARKKLKRRRK